MAENTTHLIGLHSRNRYPNLEFTPSEEHAYLNLRRGSVQKTQRLGADSATAADFDSNGRIVGIDMFDLNTYPVDIESLPVSARLRKTLSFVFVQSGIPLKAN